MRSDGPPTDDDIVAVAAFRHLLSELGPPGTPPRSPAHAYRIHFALWKLGEPPSIATRRRVDNARIAGMTVDLAEIDGRPLQHNPGPLRVSSAGRCVGCRRSAPGCVCGRGDYR